MKRVHAFGLILLAVAEFALFRETVRRDAWIYPQWYDQVQYLSEAYHAHEFRVEHGFIAGIVEAFTTISAQGALHDVLAVPVFSMLGASRTSALMMNFAAFLALQAVTFFAVRRITQRDGPAWLAVALLVALRWPWSREPGSMSDFRLDGMAACAYGFALAAAVMGNGFRTARWAIALGVAVALTVLMRFLTAVYFPVIYALLLGWVATQKERWPRIGRLVLSGLVAAVLCGPVLWMYRHEMYGYYWNGHMEGPERALRSMHLNAFASAEWVLRELILIHLGPAALALAAFAGGACWMLGRRKRDSGRPCSPASETWLITGVFLAAPMIVLAVHELKASHPVIIGVPPAVWLLVLLCGWLGRRMPSVALARIGGCAVMIALGLTTAITLAKPRSAAEVNDAARLNALVDYIYYRAEENGLTQPRFAVTRVSEALNAAPFAVLGFERHGRRINFLPALPSGLLETTRENVFTQLGSSDFVCLVIAGQAPRWPFDRQMVELLPDMRTWCDANLRYVADVAMADMTARFYERRSLIQPREGVVLQRCLERAEREPRNAHANPPAAPWFPQVLTVMGSTNAEVSRRVAAAYDVRAIHIGKLPAGLRFDATRGVVSGRFAKEGEWVERISATNAVGTTEAVIHFVGAEKTAFAQLEAPVSTAAGQAVEIRFQAFDAAGQLSFIDVLDLTEGKLLERLPAGADDGQNWSGRYVGTFTRPGRHTVNLRFVRYDPKASQPYSSFDEVREIEVMASE